jgi:ABC-type transport system substrate-binding protein
MRLSSWLPLAVLSASAVCGAATRPRYGGTLRVEMLAAPAALDPTAANAAPLRSLAFETLVRLDEAGAPQPCLALSWQHDAAARRWQFNLRPAVKFHDGSPLTAAVAAPLLQAALPAMTIAATGDTAIAIRANRPLPDLLLDLAHNGWLDTGPFRQTAFEPGRRATFAANEDYWGGRPFLDVIDVQLGRALRDQLADLQLGKADVVEVAPTDLRRALGATGLSLSSVWSSAPVSLIALAFPGSDPRLREALALSIDRAAMHTVLLQKQGEVSAALCCRNGSPVTPSPFPRRPICRAPARSPTPCRPRPARSRSLTIPPCALPALSPNAWPSTRAMPDWPSQVSPQNPRADVRLVEVRLASLDPAQALAGLAAALGLETPRRRIRIIPRGAL